MSEDRNLEAERQKHLKSARRIVIKVGTSTVTGPNGRLCGERVEPIARSIARLIKAGRQVVLVSSGAVGLGRGWLELHPSRLHDLVTKQACAAVGQSLLMDAYKTLFTALELKVAQVLLIEDDFGNWRRYSNVRHTMERLLRFGVLPIVNQNDTVSTAEIETFGHGTRTGAFSDNDRLAALVMSGLEADALVLLTNVDGLSQRRSAETHSRSRQGALAEIIPHVREITGDLKALAAGPSGQGRGGMITKIEAAQIAMDSGGIAVIANGQIPDIVDRIFSGERVGTAFLPSKRIRGKRRWITHAADVRGRVVVDGGAHRAISEGKGSLLETGVVRIESHFAPMDVVSIMDDEGREFARGIANCGSQETREGLTGKNVPSDSDRRSRGSRILVRRDNIVVLRSS